MDDFSTSATTEKLDAALAKAQGAFRVAIKDKTNPHFKSRYADLASVWECCREALAANAVSVTQWPVHTEDGRLHLITRLAHSGEWMMSRASLPVGQQNAHGYGGAITYLKRFTLSAALGIAADDDDDGNSASERGKDGGAPPKKPVDVTKDRHFGTAADDIRSGANGKPGSTAKPVTVQSDPAAWVAGQGAVDFMRAARADLEHVASTAELSKWSKTYERELDAIDEHGEAHVGKDGRTRKRFVRDLLDDAYARVKSANMLMAGD